MVIGQRTKTRKSHSVQLEYIIHVQEINPWPPSQSLRTLRAALIQWEHGDKSSGFTNQVVPSIGSGSGVGDGRIDFNESFRLSVTLMREVSIKGGHGDVYQKNCIEFNLYEPRRDKLVKGQLLGSAVLDLAAYGVVKENLSVSIPINCMRTYRNTVQPLLFLKIQPVETSRRSSSSRNGLMREASLDRNHAESVSALMSEEYAEEAEVASFTTDDDVSSQSSLAVNSNGSSSPLNKKNGRVAVNGCAGETKVDHVPESHPSSGGNLSRSSSMDLSSDIAWISKRISSQNLQSCALKETEIQQNTSTENNEHEKVAEGIQENVVTGERDVKTKPTSEKAIFSSPISKDSMTDEHLGSCSACFGAEDLPVAAKTNSPLIGLTDNETNGKHEKYVEEGRIMVEEGQKIENELIDFSQVDIRNQVTLENGFVSSTKENVATHSSFPNIDRSKNVKSVRSSVESSKSSGSTRNNCSLVVGSESKDAKAYRKETKNLLSDSQIQHLEQKIKKLEGELREAAAIEVSLYSVVAEHGSSMKKVHAPARRLSRLYFHANKPSPKSGRGSAAKSIVSGLVLVAKACGNDVPRLTFWLSNTIVLRVIISKSFENSQLPSSVGCDNGKVGDKIRRKRASPLKWDSFPSQITRHAIEDSVGDWENPLLFVAALEKIDAWIFSRIIESLWWQTFTPHMQSAAAKAIRRSMNSDSSKLYRRTSSSIDQQQGNCSLELWEKAFKDACERICPVRAGGHECGCLPVLSKLIMEQLIARLDVAMFNAILRESSDEIPTDPVADPISDAKVLPIPAGKASFGAGAQLKSAIGNWSRWLTDLFGMDDEEDNVLENDNSLEMADDDKQRSPDASSKSFHLLNSLSDLMMLPKDLLLSRTIRKEVCPAFGAPLIRRILNSFVPDEFCPDPIPGVVLEALNSEDPLDLEDDSIINLPCEAAPITYQTPSVASVASVLGEIGSYSNPQLTRSGSSLLKKLQTSDDELDELESPLILGSFQSSPSSLNTSWISNDSGSRNTVRYQLLRQVWMDVL
ncbi:hypothetical protein ACS0TY_028096 [Phlomoides rotata]